MPKSEALKVRGGMRMKSDIGCFIMGGIVIAALVCIPAACAGDVQKYTISDSKNTTQVMLPGFIDEASPISAQESDSDSSVSVHTLKSMALSLSSATPESGIEWAKVLGASYTEDLSSIRQTSDGGYIACGMTDTWHADGDIAVPTYIGNGDAWVIKMDSSGNIVWQNVYGGNGRDECQSIRPTDDGGYILIGTSNSTEGEFAGKNHGEYDIYIVKIDSSGNKKWQQTLGEGNTDFGISIRQTSDKGYILTGYEDYSHSGKPCKFTEMANAWVMKLAPDGALQWKKKFTGNQGNHGSSIIQTRDGKYVMYGFTSSTSGDGISGNHGSDDLWVVKMETDGSIMWSRLYGGSGFEATNAIYDDGIQQTSDDGLVLVGQTSSYNNGDVGPSHGAGDIWVLKLKPDGQINWSKTYGGVDYDMASGGIHETPDGGYVFAAMTLSSNSDDVGLNHGSWDYWIVRIDQTGDLLWQDVLGGSGDEQSGSIEPTTDGGYIVAGRTLSSDSGDVGHNHGWSDGWVVKLSPWLTVLVRDNDTTEFISNASVGLYDYKSKQWQNVTTPQGPVTIKGVKGSNPIIIQDNQKYGFIVTAEGYPQVIEDIVYSLKNPKKETKLKALVSPYDKSYSITCIENYDNICNEATGKNCNIPGSFKECDNIDQRLHKEGYVRNFYNKDDDVIKENFASNPTYTGHQLTESAFHYHSGHGADSSKIPGGIFGATYLQLKPWWKINPLAYTVSADDVKYKWDGKNKWVLLDSCNLLKDKNWGKALVTSHGILGYSTDSWTHDDFGDMFFDHAIKDKTPIVQSFKLTTMDIYKSDAYVGTAITKTLPQMENDPFPGVGNLEPDEDPDHPASDILRLNWFCGSGREWYS